MKGLLFKLSFLFIFNSQISYSQIGGNWVTLDGKVVNKALESPIEAKLTLESLPYGGDIRVFHSENETGDFSFKVKEDNKYKVKVESEGYMTIEEEILVQDGMEELYFSLIPSGAGSILRLDINFKQSKAEILENSFSELDKLLDMMQEYPQMEIQLEGHTDFRGSASANMRLSEKRVKAVKTYLIEKSISSNRIQTKAFGGTQPLSKESTEEAKLNNRRVEARILKVE